MIELFNTIVSRFETSYVVIDGFDECSVAEQRTVLRMINSIPAAVTSMPRFKVLFASSSDIDEDVLKTFAS
jgi:hypothetical protein